MSSLGFQNHLRLNEHLVFGSRHKIGTPVYRTGGGSECCHTVSRLSRGKEAGLTKTRPRSVPSLGRCYVVEKRKDGPVSASEPIEDLPLVTHDVVTTSASRRPA